MPLRLTLLLFAAALALPAYAQHEQHATEHATEHLGTVSFQTSCSPAVQPQFNRAVALMHSFQFAHAIDGFNEILAADPSCSMADWGIALSNWGNPFSASLKAQAQLDQGLKAVEQARALSPKTPRERAYIEAVSHLYTDSKTTDQRTRKLAYESAMATVSASWPNDDEAAIFYALAIAAAADPADKTYARQLQAGAILERLFAQYPDHPGLAHYIIHAYDVPPLAARAANAARLYSQIAPSTAHALHMPSHTFTRVGDWQASIDTNIASAAAARADHQPADELHAADYMVYAYLQTAQDKAAQQQAESAAEVFTRLNASVVIGGAASPSTAYFARAAIPARICLERRAWADAARLTPVPSPYPYTDAITYFARGLGAAHLKDAAATQAAIDSLAQMRDKLAAAKEDYWVNQVDIQRQTLTAWLAYAEGKPEAALAGMRAAAAAEDKTEKNAVTPGPLVPARELLGDLLLEFKQPAAALPEFESSLTREPNRFLSLYGAASAARQSGNQPAAQTYFARLLTVAARADQPPRPELAEARSFAENRADASH